MGKSKAECVEHQTMKAELLAIEEIVFRIAMDGVTDNGMTEMSKVASKLVGPSGMGFQMKQRIAGGGISSDAVREFDTSKFAIVGHRIQFLRLGSIPERIVD